MHQYVDWSNSMTTHRQPFHVLKRVRMRQFYRQKWKPFVAHEPQQIKSNGNGFENGYGILWELDKVDRRIQKVKSEIFVLKQQLKILQSYCASAVASHSQYSPRYFQLMNDSIR